MPIAWRHPNKEERALVEKLLSRNFPGCEELRAQLPRALIALTGERGGFQFWVSGPVAPVEDDIPTKGYYLDPPWNPTGAAVHLYLHVMAGLLHELKVAKDDGSTVETKIADLDVNDVKAT
jgi:hypothetical protein